MNYTYTDSSDPINDLQIDGPNLTEGKEDDIVLGGHYITYSANFMIFECRKCETSFEVPDIFQASSDLNKIIYQLYILSHYRNNECPKKDMMTPAIQERRQSQPKHIHWRDDSILKIDVGDGDILTDGRVIFESDSSQYHAGDMLTEKEFMEIGQMAADNRKI